MNKFYYFKNSDYIIRVPSGFYKKHYWATGISATEKDKIIEIYYSPYVSWDRATRKDWYKITRLLCVENRRSIL